MAQIPGGGFTVDPNDLYTGFEALPAGEYTVQIIDSDVCDTKDGEGKYIKMVFEVIGHQQYNGRTLFENFNVVNKSVDAVRIARQKLNTIAVLTGIKGTPKDTAKFHGKVLNVLVGVKKGQNGDDQNIIKKFTGGNDVDEDDAPKTKNGKPSFIK
jgi:hypothetical protein